MPKPAQSTFVTAPADLADAVVLDEANGEHRLGDAWRERPVVLAFVRHFG